MEYPISKYVGSFPAGRWEFVKTIETTTLAEAYEEASKLQEADRDASQYRIWDCRHDDKLSRS